MNHVNILNLTNGFEPWGPGGIEDISKPFPSGIESNIRLKILPLKVGDPNTAYLWGRDLTAYPVTVTIRFENHSDLMRLVLALDALREMGFDQEIRLLIGMLPYARQDRAVEKGEAFALKAFANVINSLGLTRVMAFDVHSNVAAGAINNFKNIPATEWARNVFTDHNDSGCAILAPDAGAAKRIEEIVKGTTIHTLQAMKHRDKFTGEVTGVEIFGDLEGRDSLTIIDDLCDGGATFIKLAEAARKQYSSLKEVDLIVSHGLFTRGLGNLLNNGIDNIYTTDSFKPYAPMESTFGDRFKTYKLENILAGNYK